MIQASQLSDVQVIPTGLFIDNLTGVGGIPRGVITEVFGDEGLGKSTICLQVVAAAQKEGLRCLWADVEWSYAPLYAESLGVDNEKLSVIQQPHAEGVLEELEDNIKNFDLVVLDSVGGLLPRAEVEKGVEGKVIGGQAGLLARFCRRVVPLLKEHDTALIVINHVFTDIMTGKITTSGGKKLAYHKSLAIRLRSSGNSIKQGDRKVGKVVKAAVWGKNKVAATEGMEMDVQLLFGKGFSAAADILNIALDKGVITKTGNTYWFGERKLGVGLGKTRVKLEENEELLAEVKKKL